MVANDMVAGSSDFTLVKRDDGKQQWVLKGKPLYYWFKDQKSGDKTGDGVKDVWHIAKPSAAQYSSATLAVSPHYLPIMFGDVE